MCYGLPMTNPDLTMAAELHMTPVDFAYVDLAVEGYLAAMMWLGFEGTYPSADDLSPAAAASIREDVLGLYLSAREAHRDVRVAMEGSQFGHDFYLTRNRHGAGFWDRGLGDLGQWLTDMSHPYGESGEYIGDDGLIYV